MCNRCLLATSYVVKVTQVTYPANLESIYYVGKQARGPMNQNAQYVTLRNWRELVEVPKKKKELSGFEEERVPIPIEVDEKNKTESEHISERVPPLFPQRLRKKNDDHMFHKFLDMLKQIHLNIPLVDMLCDVPKYAKYIKDIVANKRRLTEFETVALTVECTSKIPHKLPQKLKDPSSFTIPVRIGEIDVGRALCDLCASINMMLLSVFKILGLGASRPTTVMLQLADRSYVYPEGVDEIVPIILGQPLLATGDAVIKVREGKMIMRVYNEEAVFNVYRAIQFPSAFKEDVLEKALMLFNHLELKEEEEKLLRVLREHKCAIGWTMSDIKAYTNDEFVLVICVKMLLSVSTCRSPIGYALYDDLI
ncbi:uncharacterized protein [Nicotiana tomentosiformis]|uniref:uncharacterized protein n=1 Tax=Nicotiana tomentosiformis TaxID=4098 RepID=UPI00388CA57A